MKTKKPNPSGTRINTPSGPLSVNTGGGSVMNKVKIPTSMQTNKPAFKGAAPFPQGGMSKPATPEKSIPFPPYQTGGPMPPPPKTPKTGGVRPPRPVLPKTPIKLPTRIPQTGSKSPTKASGPQMSIPNPPPPKAPAKKPDTSRRPSLARPTAKNAAKKVGSLLAKAKATRSTGLRRAPKRKKK